jgi:hypothetical protein
MWLIGRVEASHLRVARAHGGAADANTIEQNGWLDVQVVEWDGQPWWCEGWHSDIGQEGAPPHGALESQKGETARCGSTRALESAWRMSAPCMVLLARVENACSTGIFLLIVALIGILNWMPVARLVRASFLSLKQQEFVQAARCIGARDSSICSATSCERGGSDHGCRDCRLGAAIIAE